MIRHDPLILNYPVRLRTITILVIAGIAFGMYLFPRFLGEARKITSGQINESIETIDIPQTEQIKIPEPPSRPTIPVASDDEFLDEDITIEDTDFDDLGEWEAPPPPSSGASQFKFIPYDKAPEPIGGYSALQRNVVYPDIAMEAGIEGTVVIQAFINENGIVTDTIVLKSIPNTGLDDAAIEAIKRTKWKPALQRDRKVGVWISIPVNFKLTSN